MRDGTTTGIDSWLDRVRRMAEYRIEAADFLKRASSILPAVETDVELVCRLWTIADEHDVLVCEALKRFDDALFDTHGELEITRGAEPVTTSGGDDSLCYLCTWTLLRPDSQSASVVLKADQVSGQFEFEVVDSTGARRAIGFPMSREAGLYDALTSSFFALHGRSDRL